MKKLICAFLFLASAYGATNTNIIRTLNDASNSTQIAAHRKAWSNSLTPAFVAAFVGSNINSNYTNWMPGIGERGGASIGSSNIYYAEWTRHGNIVFGSCRITVSITSISPKLVLELPIRVNSNLVLALDVMPLDQGYSVGIAGVNEGVVSVCVGNIGGLTTSPYTQALLEIRQSGGWLAGTAHLLISFNYRVEEGY